MIQPLLRWKSRSGASTKGRRLRAALQFPLPAPNRIAILAKGFAPARYIREFAASDLPAIEQWAPEAIVAPLDAALSLADRKLRSLADLSSIRVAVVVLTENGRENPAKDYRELLWQAFGVPIFEQLRDSKGTVIARECEAHDGLHVDPVVRVTSENSEELVNEPCECGAETPRLRLKGVLTTSLCGAPQQHYPRPHR